MWGTHFTFINNKYIIARPSRGYPKKSTHLNCKIFFWGLGIWSLLSCYILDGSLMTGGHPEMRRARFLSPLLNQFSCLNLEGWQVVDDRSSGFLSLKRQKKEETGLWEGSWPTAQRPQAVLVTEREHSLPRTHHGTHTHKLHTIWLRKHSLPG